MNLIVLTCRNSLWSIMGNCFYKSVISIWFWIIFLRLYPWLDWRLWWQWFWWHSDVGDLKLMTNWGCWLPEWPILSPTHFVSNIRQQPRCNPRLRRVPSWPLLIKISELLTHKNPIQDWLQAAICSCCNSFQWTSDHDMINLHVFWSSQFICWLNSPGANGVSNAIPF